MRDLSTGAPICGTCGTHYQVPPMLRDPIDTAARAAGWRLYVGRTLGGQHIDTAICPACARGTITRKDTLVPDTPDDEAFTWPPSAEEAADFRLDLKEILAEIEKHDQDYEPRYVLVLLAVATATAGGLTAGFRIDPAEPDWPVAYIELPTGQVSWHIPAHKQSYDQHTTAEKYARIKAYVEASPSPA